MQPRISEEKLRSIAAKVNYELTEDNLVDFYIKCCQAGWDEQDRPYPITYFCPQETIHRATPTTATYVEETSAMVKRKDGTYKITPRPKNYTIKCLKARLEEVEREVARLEAL
jgi:hypothetical protein